MSHLMVETDPGTSPLAKYNSLTDNHLAGYFSSPRRHKHLRKAGLITRSGHLVSENTYRLNMVQKEHKKRVKNMLAQAIVEKTLDLERNRNHVIRQKLEEIAKLELVQRIRASERKPREDNLPYLSPRSPRRPVSGPAKPKPHSPAKYRPISAPENNHRPESGSTKASTNFDDEEEGDVEYLDVTPRRNGDVSFRSDNNNLDYKQLYTLNAAALRKYAMTLAKLEQGRGSSSPYVTTQVPIPPRSPRAPNRSARSRRYVSSGHSDRSLQGGTHTAPGTFHSSDLTTVHPRQLQSVVQVVMRYHGWNLSLARDDRDPTNLVLVEQQHCGGNTLTVFKDNLLPNTEFSFSSHRHRGYPFSLTIYVDGRMDCRVSTCCEHRHSKNVRIGGPNGHFSLVSVTGNSPCYKCQVERGGKKKKKKKQAAAPEDGTEEVIVMETHQAPENQVEEKKDQTKDEDEEDSEDEGKEILVPVEKEADDDNTSAIEQNEIESGDYDDDFEDDGEEEDKSKKVENVKEEEKIQTAQKQNKEKSSGNVEVKEEEDDEENEVTIEGLAVESPRNVHDTPNITVVEKEGGDNGRKIDAYSSEEEDLEGERNKVVAMEKEQKRAEVPQLSIRPNTSTPVNQTNGKQKTRPPASTKTKDSDTKSNNPKNSKHDESYLPLEAKWSRRDDVSPSSEPTNDVIEPSSPQNSSSNQNSPNKTPDVVYTVWSEEETASSQSNDQDDWTEKKGQITQNILDEFGDKEVSQYEADDEGTERSTKDTKNQLIAGEIIKSFGQNADPVDDTSLGNQNKNSRVAEEIVKNFGQNEQTEKDEDRSTRVAEEIIKTFGQNDDRNQDSTQVSLVQQEFNQSKNSRVAEEIVKNFGQNDKQDRESSPDSTGQRENQSKNSRVAEEIVKNFGQEDEQSRESTERRKKNRRVADEIVKNFGQNPDSDAENSNQRVASEFVRTFGKVDPQEEADKNQRIAEEIVKSFGQSEEEKEDSNKNQRVAEEIVKSFGQTEEEKESNKNQRVAEEIVKNFSQIDDPEQRFDQERPSVNNLDSEKPVTKDSAALVSRSPGIGNPDLRKTEEKSESGDSTEREITQRKKDSQEFFKPALEKKQNSVSDTETSSSGTETESDSETSSSSSSTDSNDVVTTTSNSNLTTKTIEAPTTGSNVRILPSSSSSSSLPRQPPTDNAKADVNPSINNVAMTTNASKQYKESDTEDTSSDSDTESGSSSSSSDSTSDSEEEKEKDPATPANTQGSEVKQVTGQSTEVANKTQTQKGSEVTTENASKDNL